MHRPSVPQFTLLMAVYNAASYLSQAIESVSQQTLADWELICVDDGSSDDSLCLLQHFAALDSRIKVLSGQGNQGPAKARNRGLEVASGQYIAMLDADDWLSENALQCVADIFAQHPATDSVLFTLIEEYPGSRNPYPMPFGPADVFTGKEAFRLSLDWRIHGLYAVRRAIHLRFPYDDSCRLHSDDNTTRIHYLHSREVRMSAGEYHYRKRTDSISFAVGLDHFGYLDANLSMKRLLEAEKGNVSEAEKGSVSEVEKGSEGLVTEADLLFYEHHRWLNYVGMHWYLFINRRSFDKTETEQIHKKLRCFYDTFDTSLTHKFGYTRYKKYSLFLMQEWLYFRMRWLMGRR